jgi:hypothetical protein
MKLPLFTLILLFAACHAKTKKGQMNKYDCERYDYYFYESTGDNQFIGVGGVQHSIRFDKDASDKNAYASLFALKWNVLYPNSKGNIKIYGHYKKQDSTFILIHWWLKAPFKVHQYISDSELLDIGTSPLMQKEKLTAEYFNTPLSSDPKIYNAELAPAK